MGCKIEYTIYKVTNTEDGKIYIGATTKDLKQRKQDHNQKARSGNGHFFHEAILTSGPECFHWEQIDTAYSINELSAKERGYIKKYDAQTNGYNGDCGGGFKKYVFQYSTEGDYLETYDSLENAANAVNANKTDISAACLGKIKSCKGFYWSYVYNSEIKPPEDNRLKAICQFSMDGRILNRFNSIADASRVTKVNKSSIAKCCRGERKSASGFMWKYKE